jgi:hypothetical protein
MCLIFAYKITDTSQYDSLVAQLPKWGNADQFVIEARAQGDPTRFEAREEDGICTNLRGRSR